MDEKFCLKWNDFQNAVSQSFGALRQEKDFFGVTFVKYQPTNLSWRTPANFLRGWGIE